MPPTVPMRLQSKPCWSIDRRLTAGVTCQHTSPWCHSAGMPPSYDRMLETEWGDSLGRRASAGVEGELSFHARLRAVVVARTGWPVPRVQAEGRRSGSAAAGSSLDPVHPLDRQDVPDAAAA